MCERDRLAPQKTYQVDHLNHIPLPRGGYNKLCSTSSVDSTGRDIGITHMVFVVDSRKTV